MKLSELIRFVGDENITFQNLDADSKRWDYGAKAGATITFATDPAHVMERVKQSETGEKPKCIGLIVWLPREKLPPEFAQ